MPKLYYPTPDELQGARPLNENQWFRAYQPLLLKLANTDYGRDLLCLDPRRKRPAPIVSMDKNLVRRYLGQANERHYWESDVRIGAKWGNVIRSRWLEVEHALYQVNQKELNRHGLFRLPRLVLSYRGWWLPVPAGATVTTVYPDADPETATVDGSMTRSQADNTWANLRDGAATSVNSTAASQSFYEQASGASADTYARLRRTGFLWDASSIADTDTKDSAIASFYGAAGATDGLTSAMILNLTSFAPASNTDLVGGDFAVANFGSTKFVTGGYAQSSWSASAYNDLTLNADGLTNISLTGISKFGGRSEHDIDNVAPGGPFTSQADDVEAVNAETAGTTQDPKLAVTHSAVVTFIAKAIFF